MRYPKVEYGDSPSENALNLLLMDGTSRIVTFESQRVRQAALLPGQAELAAAAILTGRMPIGCVEVSLPVARSAEALLQETFEVANPRCYQADEVYRIRIAAAKAVADGRQLR